MRPKWTSSHWGCHRFMVSMTRQDSFIGVAIVIAFIKFVITRNIARLLGTF